MLRKACKADIPKFCHGILTKAKDDSELEGQVISCLKLRYADQVHCWVLNRAVLVSISHGLHQYSPVVLRPSVPSSPSWIARAHVKS